MPLESSSGPLPASSDAVEGSSLDGTCLCPILLILPVLDAGSGGLPEQPRAEFVGIAQPSSMLQNAREHLLLMLHGGAVHAPDAHVHDHGSGRESGGRQVLKGM